MTEYFKNTELTHLDPKNKDRRQRMGGVNDRRSVLAERFAAGKAMNTAKVIMLL